MRPRSGLPWIILFAVFVLCFFALSCTDGSGDDDDDAAADDDAGDDDTGDDDAGGDEPGILDTVQDGCKNGAGAGLDEPWPQDIILEMDGDVLVVTHVNGVFNCCIVAIDVTMDLGETVIDLYEVENAPEPCDCICPYDVVTRIGGLAPKTYTVNIYANGEFAISGEVTVP